MDQPSLFTVPPVSVTPIPREREQAVTPAETRRKGLTEAQLQRDNLWSRMLTRYAVGPLTDAEMAGILQVERTTIIGRRDELVKFGKVKAMNASRVNTKTGVENALWGLV